MLLLAVTIRFILCVSSLLYCLCFAVVSYIVPGNTAKTGGAVILVVANQNIKFEYCVFESNTATLMGGAVTQSYNNEVTRFTGACAHRGFLYFCLLPISVLSLVLFWFLSCLINCCFADCTFQSNAAVLDGGAIYMFSNNTDTLITGTLFVDNQAAQGTVWTI